jgi:hypothetical protein
MVAIAAAIRTRKGVVMVRTLLGVVLTGTVLLGWCWYYSDYLPQHLQRTGMDVSMFEKPVPPGGERTQSVDEDNDGEVPVTLVESRLAFHPLAQDASGSRDFGRIGLGLATFLVVAVVAALLLMMARLPSYVARVGFVLLLGVFAAILVQMCDYLFWGQSWESAASKGLFFVSAALIAGLVLAFFVRPEPMTVKLPVRVR